MRIRNLFEPGSGMKKKSDPGSGKKHPGSTTVKKYTRSLINFTDKYRRIVKEVASIPDTGSAEGRPGQGLRDRGSHLEY
jgi:hypothetical protein